MNLVKLVWVIAIHSIIHGALGAFFVASSEYVNKKPALIYSFMVLNVILIFLGAGVFCTVLWRLPICARFFGALLIIMAITYITVGSLYYAKYFRFLANSLPDKLVFHTDFMCWVGPESVMTIWHVITALLLLFMLLWLVYGILLCKYAYLACCIPCSTPCKPKVPKPKKCLPICPMAPPAPCLPPCPPTPPPPRPYCTAPCHAKPCSPPPEPLITPACPASPPPQDGSSPSCKRPPKFVMEVNKGFSG